MRSAVDFAPGPVSETARAALRRATASHHERVDRLFSIADLSTPTGYGRFLLAQARAHLPVEAALTRAGAENVMDDWLRRQRDHLLRADLAELGITAPDHGVAISFDDENAALGGIYVLEGSRLGGTLLRRQVPPTLPTAFLSASDAVGWRRLLATLEARLVTPAKRHAAIAAAIDVFSIFEMAAAAL